MVSNLFRDKQHRDNLLLRLLPLVSLLGISSGALCSLAGHRALGDDIWAATVLVMLFPLGAEMAAAFRKGQFGVDIIAFLSMLSTLLVGEYLAGAIVSLMYSGGGALEAYASGRARRDLTSLLKQAPQTAQKLVDGTWQAVPADTVLPGDTLLVRSGDLVAVDGLVLSDRATVNEAMMTGESLPISYASGHGLRSGVSNAGPPFEMTAMRSAQDSSYAALVRLVESAESERAPFIRLADRYSLWFLAITLALAGSAWLASSDPVRAVAVLVVATPCPLILAAPIALVGGISRLTREGVIVKSGTAIERLGDTRSVLLDKTGTLTYGDPQIESIRLYADASEREVIGLAASLDQLSSHVVASALVRAAREQGIYLFNPEKVIEAPGSGISGLINGEPVAVGSLDFVASLGVALPGADAAAEGVAQVAVERKGELLGIIRMTDRLRPDAAGMIDSLHASGVERVLMVTGDRKAVAANIARQAGLDEVYSEHSPQEKLEVVARLAADPGARPVVMVGDGVNDAPALAMADVGIAMGAAGSTISAETADCVVTVNQVDRVSRAIVLGRRTLRIAKQSVRVGIALSVAAMLFAAFGYLPPVFGALLQEGIDVLVILNALRVLGGD